MARAAWLFTVYSSSVNAKAGPHRPRLLRESTVPCRHIERANGRSFMACDLVGEWQSSGSHLLQK